MAIIALFSKYSLWTTIICIVITSEIISAQLTCSTSTDCPDYLPKCFGGTCYGCLIDSDCTTSSGKIDTPVCQNNVCSGCSSDSQCSGSAPYCSYNGSCVSCKSNADCKESTRPICSSGGICSTCSKFNTCPNSLKCVPTGACVASVHQCTVSSDCSGNTPICMNRVCVGCTKIGTTTNTCAGLVNKYCISTGQCGQCTNLPNAPNTGCKPTSTTPICNSNYVCSACSSDNDCKRVVGAAGTYCATSGINSGKCVACTSSSQCANNSPICSASLNICLKCFADSDCISRSASLKKCISGSCQGCLNNSDCTPTSLGTTATSTTPICDTVSASIPTCRACSLDSDCSGFKNMPYCNAGTGQCVACNTNTNAGCSGATPICDSITYTCRSCTPNDCTTYDFTVCATQGSNQGTCVECETSSDCSPTSNKPICIANKCVACTQDTDCTSHSISSGSQALKYCTTFAGSSKGSCVQCFASTQCHSDSPQTPICNANQCFSCSQTNPCPDYAPNCYTSLDDSNLQGSCFQCATSSECFTNTGLTTSKTPICSATGTCIGCNSTNDCSVISLASSCKVIDTNTTGPQCVQCNYDNDCSSSLYSISTAPFCFNNTCVNSTTAAIPYAVNMQFKLAWKPTYADTTSDDYKALVANYIAFIKSTLGNKAPAVINVTSITKGPLEDLPINRKQYWLSQKLATPTSNSINFVSFVQTTNSATADALSSIPTNVTVSNNMFSGKLLKGATVTASSSTRRLVGSLTFIISSFILSFIFSLIN